MTKQHPAIKNVTFSPEPSAQGETIEFSKREITVTLTGAEWFAVIAGLAKRPLSGQGRIHLKVTGSKMAAQLGAAS